jgi:hypothetical protein
MFRVQRFVFTDDDDEGADRQTASLAGLAFALFLVVIGLFLVQALRHKTAVEDCILSGRSNCDLIVHISH